MYRGERVMDRMKAVIKSVSPRICEKVANGDCTVLVSKTVPKCEVPFKGYIYCTKAKEDKYILEWHDYETGKISRIDGKVIGEFVCDKIDRIGKCGINNNFDYCYLSLNEWGNDDIEIEIRDIQESCIPKNELNAYGANSSCLYAWHISDLKIYDTPKKLSEFYKPCKNKYQYCEVCAYGSIIIPSDEEEYALYHGGFYERYETVCHNTVTRPPQSYMYVEEV